MNHFVEHGPVQRTGVGKDLWYHQIYEFMLSIHKTSNKMMFGGQLLKSFFRNLRIIFFYLTNCPNSLQTVEKSSSDTDIRNIAYQKVQEL